MHHTANAADAEHRFADCSLEGSAAAHVAGIGHRLLALQRARAAARLVSLFRTWTAVLVAAVLFSSFFTPVADAAVVRASSNAAAQVRVAERVAGILQNLLQSNQLKFDGEVRLVTKSGFHAEAFFGKPGYIELGEAYSRSLSDGELAFVLAHELVHLLTDHAERVKHFYANRVSAGLASPEDLHHALEAEADRIGLEWARKAGAQPEQAVSALQRAYGGASGSFSTHPALDSRAAALLALR